MEPFFPLLNHLFIKKQFQGSLNYSWIWAELTEGFTRGQTPPTCTESSAGASAVNYFECNKTFGCWAQGIKAQATKGYIQLKRSASSSQRPRGYSTQLACSRFRAKAPRAQSLGLGSPPKATGHQHGLARPPPHALKQHQTQNTALLQQRPEAKPRGGNQASSRGTWGCATAERMGCFPLPLPSPVALGFTTQTTQARSLSWATQTWGHA